MVSHSSMNFPRARADFLQLWRWVASANRRGPGCGAPGPARGGALGRGLWVQVSVEVRPEVEYPNSLSKTGERF